ncbi:MAG: hypothetical protein ACLTW9_15480 [Enterocloster sp.]
MVLYYISGEADAMTAGNGIKSFEEAAEKACLEKQRILKLTPVMLEKVRER